MIEIPRSLPAYTTLKLLSGRFGGQRGYYCWSALNQEQRLLFITTTEVQVDLEYSTKLVSFLSISYADGLRALTVATKTSFIVHEDSRNASSVPAAFESMTMVQVDGCGHSSRNLVSESELE